MSGEESFSKKLMMAAAMLLFRSHRKPGVKGWELKHRLGRNYIKIIDALNSHLKSLGLEVKTALEEGEDLDKARFYITMARPLMLSDIVTAGWSIDEVAALAVTLSILVSRGGKAPVKDVLEVLETKFPKWKAEAHLERAIRRGYIDKGEDDVLTLGWRAKVELDQKELLTSMLEARPSEQSGEESQEE
ncbi:MAG: hypothetical protein N3F65_02010 [Nitrososphaeria archaeon]|nr:hypothetical protein [Aigarchaeota archaeon]MCX8187367.1 hypothetical protein [Nitrososphaeria archaeon]MDW8021668.1 hypothetical protein [Nitrososphaerota archaeon]